MPGEQKGSRKPFVSQLLERKMDICSILKLGLEKQIHREISLAVFYKGKTEERKPEWELRKFLVTKNCRK